jgi:hypothetical protein
MPARIEIESMITVGNLAEKLLIPVTRLIGELMKNGVMATINEQIDFDTAQIIVGELDLDVELVRAEAGTEAPNRRCCQGRSRGHNPAHLGLPGHAQRSTDYIPRYAWPRGLCGHS